ncbi:exocyst complex component EXO70A1-like isoform X2 [Phragmites australis]|uniref:exocyst complex component EXO70A1-like isoform X2 n=1 Tax=Phragmites australis TaxID=29695 RepID=UPI002D7A009B|nr:exocyst complex component EXO70A1-like isoform X2 [Phragmites australis]
MERAAAEVLREKANLLRESMQRGEAIHRDAVAAFASITSHMTAIDDAMQPAQARTYDACRVHDNVRRSLKAVEPMVRRLDLVQEADLVLLNGPSKGLTAYLDAVDKLRSVEYFFNSKRSYRTSDNVLKHADELLCKAAVELENEFHRLLSKCSKPVELEYLFNSLPNLDQRLSSENIFAGSKNLSSKDSSGGQIDVNAAYTLPTLIDPCYVPLLSKLVQKSVQLGRHQQFLKIYREVRGSTLDLNLKYLGVEYVTTEEMQNTQAENLDAKIAQWIQFYRIGVKLLFAAERELCDQIFEGYHALKDHCFAEVTAKSLSTILSFGEAVAKSQASPDKLFMLLDMYEASLELRPGVEVVFEGHACSENRKLALSLTKCLAQTTKRTFSDFKENILKDSANSTTTDGAVHPLTSYVLNYTKFLFDYQSSLKQILEESGTGDGTNSDLASQIMDVIHALETNLDAKSKQYKDPCLAHIFLMNNIQYIIRSICSSEVKDLFGDDWIQRHRRIVQQHATQYRRVSWGKVRLLKSQPLQHRLGSTRESNQGSLLSIGSNSITTSKSVIKERFRSFNMQFEEVCQTQIKWAIPDRELRDNLILAIAEILLPAYRDFLKRFGPLVGNSHSSSKYIKYTPEALEEALGNLFAKKLLIEQGC